ncbi:hypothetical protein BT96DRAFT_999396 [Gymnopus androsaceus JB14]|uniref:Uncharacterized protein n=1 Tax=Gymnopus androsaceus JB14 TaxID=1447944 RepID=A0A6A4H731_9AGAR|nr:hypothetical protein BT96DRAFT_999396 [Gymnopus androsaceus JB14]
MLLNGMLTIPIAVSVVAVASSSALGIRNMDSSKLKLSRSILVDVEAQQSDDELDDSDDDELMAAERARQAAESVPLRRRDEVYGVLEVAKRWEHYAVQGEWARQEIQRKPEKSRQNKRKAQTDLSSLPRPEKRARAKPSSSPPPNTIPLKVQTCTGTVLTHIPVISGENELQYEIRAYDISQCILREAESKELARMVADIRNHQLCFPPGQTPPAAPSHEIAEEWPLSAPTPAGGTPIQSPSRSQTPPVPLSPWHDGAPTPAAGATPTQHSRSLSQAPPSSFLSDEWLGGAAGGVTTPVCRSLSPLQAPPLAPLPLFLPETDGDSPAPSNDINVGETDKLSNWQVTIFYYQL